MESEDVELSLYFSVSLSPFIISLTAMESEDT